MFTVVLLAALSVLYLLYRLLCRRDRLPTLPYPPGTPIFGNVLQLTGSVAHIKLTEWAKTYGPIYKASIVGRPLVVVTGRDELYEMLVLKGKDFAGRMKSFRIDHMMEKQSDMLSPDYSQQQQFRRKILQSHLKQYGQGQTRIEDVTISSVQDMINGLLAISPDSPIDIISIVQSTIIDITCTIVLAKKQENDEERKKISALSDHMAAVLSASGTGIFLDVFPWLRFFGNETFARLLDMRKIRQSLFSDWKKELQSDSFIKEDNVIYKMFKMMESGEELNEVNIEVLTMTLFLGATSTTVSTFSCLLNILAHKPEVQTKLQDEMDRHMGRDGRISFQDREKLPYHFATILELLRFTTVLPVGVPHKTMCDTSIAGHPIPNNCSVWANLWGLHHEEKIWGDPFTFRPERFLDEAGGVVPADHPLRKVLMPFGAGPRVCLGDTFAKTRMFLLLGMIMQRLTILPETSIANQPSYDSRDMKLGGVLSPNPFKIRIRERE